MKSRIPKTKQKAASKSRQSRDERLPLRNAFTEKAVDTVPLSQDVPQELRESDAEALPAENANTVNWSAAEDRGEDLINERDPFIQQPERDTQIPPELIQQRAYSLYEQRGGNPGGNLADWFEAERQLRSEVINRNKKT